MRSITINLPFLLCLLFFLLLLEPSKSGLEDSIQQSLSVSIANAKAEHPAPIQTQSDMKTRTAGEWRPGSYRGLIMGQSTYQDMLRVLGSPKGAYTDNVDEIVSYTYSESADYPGILSVIVNRRSGRIIGGNINPRDSSKERATAYFGNDFVTTRYSFDNCVDEPKSDELYESPSGTITYLEYRERGIALFVNSEGKIGGIYYVSKPIGKVKASCK